MAYPKWVYKEDGQSAIAKSDEHLASLGEGWFESVEAARKASPKKVGRPRIDDVSKLPIGIAEALTTAQGYLGEATRIFEEAKVLAQEMAEDRAAIEDHASTVADAVQVAKEAAAQAEAHKNEASTSAESAKDSSEKSAASAAEAQEAATVPKNDPPA